jgi:HK97 family phage major capsid protein
MKRAYSILEIKSVTEQADHVVVKGVATTPKTDRIGDIVEPLGARFQLPIPLLLDHMTRERVGRVMFANPTKSGIPFEALLPIVKEAGRLKDRVDEAIHSLKYRLLGAVSIGFQPIEDAVEHIKNGFRFKEWEWLELSLVTIPANPDAVITSVKSIDDEIRAALGRKRVDPMRTAATSNAGATAQPQKAPTMKTIEQQLIELQASRASKAARIKELTEGCGGDFATLQADEQTEYDGLAADVRDIDTNVGRLKAAQTAIYGATPVTPAAGTDPAQAQRARTPRIELARAPALEKGVAFAQYVKLLGRAKGNPMLALSFAQAAGHLVDKRVPAMLKTAVEGGTTAGTATAGNWGMELVGDEAGVVADFIEYLRPMTILGKFGANGVPALRRVPFRAPLVGMTSGGSGYWVGEGKGKPLTKFGFSRTHLDPLKVAAIAVVSMELLADSSPSVDPIIRDQLGAALREKMDVTFIDPTVTASTGVSPASITNGATSAAASGTNAAAVRVDVRTAFNAFIAANNAPTSGVWVMSSRVALTLSLMMNSLGQPEFPGISMNGGTFAGLPVITSEHVPDDTAGDLIVLVNAQDIYYGDDGDVKVDTSEHASLEMADSVSGDSGAPTAAQLVSMYQTNSVAFRAERRVDWMRRRDSGVRLITGVNYA